MEKWTKLSKPKLRDRIDLWIAKYDAARVRIDAAVEEHRYVDIEPGGVGLAFLIGPSAQWLVANQAVPVDI